MRSPWQRVTKILRKQFHGSEATMGKMPESEERWSLPIVIGRAAGNNHWLNGGNACLDLNESSRSLS